MTVLTLLLLTSTNIAIILLFKYIYCNEYVFLEVNKFYIFFKQFHTCNFVWLLWQIVYSLLIFHIICVVNYVNSYTDFSPFLLFSFSPFLLFSFSPFLLCPSAPLAYVHVYTVLQMSDYFGSQYSLDSGNSLELALFIPAGIAVLGGIGFMRASRYIDADRKRALPPDLPAGDVNFVSSQDFVVYAGFTTS